MNISKRISALLCSVVLLLASVAASMPVPASALATNLITNPSVETATGTSPTSWKQGKWGTNTTTFTYDATTGNTGTKSLKVNMTGRTSGDAKWYFNGVAVKPNTQYTYSEFYKSTVATEIDIQYTDTTNKLSYVAISSPAASSAAWTPTTSTFTTPANVKLLTVFHVINKVGTLQTDDFSLVEGNGTVTPPVATPPTVSITAPAANATVSGTQALTATATDAVAIAGVQFKVDGTNVGAEDTTAPYSVNLGTTTLTNGTHTISATARNNSNLTASATQSVTVQNITPPVPTPPTVSITSPTAGVTVSGSTTISATATDAQGITNVQFKLDGSNIGVADTSSPYTVDWDSKTTTNTQHVITAVATNTANLSTTSSPVNITVSNTVIVPPTPTNLITNPSVETGTTVPTDWTSNSWGTNTSNLTFEPTGRTGTHSLKATVTSYSNGDAKWSFNSIPVTAGSTYSYSNWYKSDVDTELDAAVTMSNGTVQYYYLTSASASPADWSKVSAQFTAPAGAVNISIFQVIAKVGYVQNDDFDLEAYAPAKFNRALVSLTFDDGWRTIHTNGLPLLKKYGFVSTQYLNSRPIVSGYPDYMSYQMVKDFAAQGSELAWHTRTHADLTQLSVAKIKTELTIPANFLTGIGQNASIFKNFATPYGAYNTTSLTEIKKLYGSHRSTDVGFNSKDSFDRYNIKVQNIVNTTTPSDVQAWVNQAIATNTWLVIVYHEVDAGAEDPTYAVTPANLDQELNLIKQSGIAVTTVGQALAEITPQL